MNDSNERLDGPALERLLDEHLPGLRAFVRLKAGPTLRARESESDVVQSTCREVLVRADTFQHGGEAGFKHWLYSTALRKILNKHEFHTAGKRDARRDADGDVQLLGAYDAFCSPSRLASAREELDRVENAFEKLAPDHREVVLLSRVVGLSRAEVAQEMGRTEASVRNLLNRALVHLAQHLEQV
jgi:RNA polymerase sigma-70 factor (ECF subfamily)